MMERVDSCSAFSSCGLRGPGDEEAGKTGRSLWGAPGMEDGIFAFFSYLHWLFFDLVVFASRFALLSLCFGLRFSFRISFACQIPVSSFQFPGSSPSLLLYAAFPHFKYTSYS